MKIKTVTLLFVGLSAGCLVGLAQNPADEKVQKLYNQPATSGTKASAPADAPTAAPAEPVGEVLPLVQFEDSPLVEVIKTLARTANLNVIFDPRVTTVGPDGKSTFPSVSIRLENVTAQNVLEALLNNNNLRLERDPKTKISRVTIKDPAAAEPLVTKIYQLKYSYPTNMAIVVRPTISQRSQIVPDARTSQLIVMATEKELLDVDNLIEKLDTATKQVLIEAKILETTKSPSSMRGINWGPTFGSQNFSFGNGQTTGTATTESPGAPTTTTLPGGRTITETPANSSSTILNSLLGNGGLSVDTARGFSPNTAFLNADGVRAVLSWFNQDVDSELIATPRTVTADNSPATISVAREIPIYSFTTGGSLSGPTVSVTYTNLGTMLTVTPRISANNSIALKVVPEVSDVESVDRKLINDSIFEANIFIIRKAETHVLVPSGNTLVMAGLIKDNYNHTRTKVPILGDLPGLGYAFRSKSKDRRKANLIIFITPTIVTDEDFMPTQTDFLKKKPPVDESDSAEDPRFKGTLDSAKPHDWSKPVY
jgi:type II secretory pathway component GspD/PulD (secretin)